MAWYTVNTKELWTGETHEFLGKTYSGATRTPSSTRLEEGPDPEVAPKKKAAPKKAAKK